MKTIKYVGLASPWVDTLGGSGLTWTTNQVATVADDVANELLSYVTIFQFVANVPVGLPDLQAGFDSGTPAQQAQFQSSVSGAQFSGILGSTVLREATWMPNRGGTFIPLGDSICAGSDYSPLDQYGVSWPNIAQILSGGNLRMIRNAGVPGNTTAQMLARFDTDVAPYKPSIVTLKAGTNDIGGTAEGSFKADYIAIIKKILAIGAMPSLGTIPPSSAAITAKAKQRIRSWNEWIKWLARTNSFPLLDFYAVLVDSATSGYASAYYNDGTHPSAAGYYAMGVYAASILNSVCAGYASNSACVNSGDEASLVYDGCFTAHTGSSASLGWSDSTGIPAGSVLDYATVTGIRGKALRLTHTAAAGARTCDYTLYTNSTVTTAAVVQGTTTITTAARADYRGILWINPGQANAEFQRIVSSSGGGPQTNTLENPLFSAHESGETVISNAAPGDTLFLTCRVISDGGVAWAVSLPCQGSAYSPGPALGMSAGQAVNGGLIQAVITLPPGSTTMSVRLQAQAGTGVISFGEVGLYNLTRMGLA